MRYHVNLYEAFVVSRNGVDLPPAPNQTVSMLLLGLLAQDGGWMNRQAVATKLYPEATGEGAENALRQTVLRLRRWLDEGTIEGQRKYLRLAPDRFEADWGPDGGPGRLAPNIEHAWADEIRLSRGPTVLGDRDSVAADFVAAIETTSRFDQAAARGILAADSFIFDTLPAELRMRLLTLTKPTSIDSSHAFEHLSRRSSLLYCTGDFQEALVATKALYRLGRHRNSLSKMAKAARFAIFICLESGKMAEAEAWLGRYRALCHPTKDALPLVTAESALVWNSDRAKEALHMMKAAESLTSSEDLISVIQYWHNCSVLAAEAGDVDTSLRATEELQRLVRQLPDNSVASAVQISVAHSQMAAGNLHDSAMTFRKLTEGLTLSTERVGRMYAAEASAEVLARAGEFGAAARAWSVGEGIRRQSMVGASPRVRARRSRILRLAS